MRSFKAPLRFDLVVSSLVFAAALAVRLPNLMLIPTFIDEGVEMLMALDIAQGQHWVLTFRYIGPLFMYLTAALFRLFGASVLLPRLTVAVLGAALVVVMYWLGRRLAGRLAGLVAALITLVSPVLVIEASHYGWTNSLTPLFVALTLLALVEGVATGHTAWLAAAGLLAALALQTHPTCAVALVGIGLWVIRRPAPVRRLPLSRWLGAAGMFLVGYSPVIIGNLREWRRFTSAVGFADYAFAPTLSPTEYLARLVTLLETVSQLVLRSYGPWTADTWAAALVVVGLVLVGLWASASRDNRVLLYTLLASLVLYPLLVKATYQRYLAFFVPLVTLGLAIGVDEWRRLVRRWEPGSSRTGRLVQTVVSAAVLLTPVSLAGYAALNVNGYYQAMTARGVTNAEHFRLRDTLRAYDACRGNLIIAQVQPDFQDPVTSRGWFGLLAMDYILTMEGCRHGGVEPHNLDQRLAEARPAAWLLTYDTSLAPPPGYGQVELVGVFELGVIDARAMPLALYRLRSSGD